MNFRSLMIHFPLKCESADWETFVISDAIKDRVDLCRSGDRDVHSVRRIQGIPGKNGMHVVDDKLVPGLETWLNLIIGKKNQ